MKMHPSEFAKLTGVSVRTLHYYDEIGLLRPAAVDDNNGYRCYDERSLERMQEILFYRELDFPLKSISMILSSENYDRKDALSKQKQLLVLKKERLERLISAIDSAVKGEKIDMSTFDNSEFETLRSKYEQEAKEKWGNTAAYKEFEEKSKDRTPEKQSMINEEMDRLIGEFAELMGTGAAPSGDKAKALVKKWQDYISRNFYTCTDEILCGLGEMYSADERFRKNIDRHGEGTACFMTDAIKEYCAKKS